MNTSGMLMPNHRKHSANRVPKGTAPLDFWPHTCTSSQGSAVEDIEVGHRSTIRAMPLQVGKGFAELEGRPESILCQSQAGHRVHAQLQGDPHSPAG